MVNENLKSIIEVLGQILGFLFAILLIIVENTVSKEVLMVCFVIALAGPIFSLISTLSKDDYSNKELIVIILMMVFVLVLVFAIKPTIVGTLFD
jgi:hypothetical protein